MHIVLIGGLWLTGAAWDAVVPEIAALGHTAVPITLPGQGDGTTEASLDDQVATVVAAVDEAPGQVVVVGHSAGSSLAWLAADERPEKIASVVFIGGFPEEDGGTYADQFEPVDGLMGFPGWATFEGPDSVDMSDELKTSVQAKMVPVPAGVSRGIVHLKDERRYAVPGVLVCPEFSPEQARGWLEDGDLPELAKMERLELVDIDSGHWPMFTQPRRLAELVAAGAPF